MSDTPGAVGRLSRRGFLGASGGALAAPLLVGRAQAAARATGTVDNGRSDGVRTGGNRAIRIDGRYDVWVRQVGTGPIPVLTLHGGPGMSHYYLECFEEFLPPDECRFWLYDQLGCGFSDRPDDTSLWTIDRYREEVEQVRKALGLDRFILFGHSWGGLLAMEYALRYQKHLTALVVSNMTASTAAYVEYAKELRARLPADVVARMQTFEDRGEFHAPEYEQLLRDTLYQRHFCRLDPWPEPVDRTMRFLNAQVYETMQGPDEFRIVGNYKDWDRWSDLHRIDVPTLLLVGRHDTMSPVQMQRMSTLMPRARCVVLENGSHMSMYDDQAAYFRTLVGFLRGFRTGGR
ncbi:MAG TPA: proline iminopeptidase-family hydrolase [Steroidobacteraceae bacterium]|nr:proline iminopeptidase-family hydrolase [Steroidobacteraceae bacterium]